MDWSSASLRYNKWFKFSPVSSRNGLFKTILPLKLLFWLKALSAEKKAQRSVSWENDLKPHLLRIWTNELSLPKCHQEMAFSRPYSHLNYHVNSKLCLLREWLKAWSTGSKAQSSAFLGLEQMSWVFPSATVELPFQNHLAIKISYWLETLSPRRMAWSLSSPRLNNDCAEMRLSQCHWQTAFSRLSSH